MSRSLLPYHATDISALARSLSGQFAACDHHPTHVELLNMLARAQGCRNFQHFRAQTEAQTELAQSNEAPPPPSASEIDFVRIKRLLRVFDAEGRLIRWPPKVSQQTLCLWALWSDIPARRAYTEAEINQHLQAAHLFGDPALLRRWLCDYGMMSRTRDGSDYRRIEQRPPAEALALIAQLGLIRAQALKARADAALRPVAQRRQVAAAAAPA